MAGNGSGKIVQGLTLAVVTVSVGAAIGYYAGGSHSVQPAATTSGVQETGTPPDTTSAPAATPRRLKPTPSNSDYTAPNAPRIHIIEAKAPSLGSASPDASAHHHILHRSSDTTDVTDIPTPDAEASQEASQSASAHDSTSSAPTPPSAGASSDTEATQAGATETAPTETAIGGDPTQPPTVPTSTASAPTKHAAPLPAGGDPEASQVGDNTSPSKTASAAQYRIQAGTFTDAKNAHDYLTNLQSRGYDASLHTESQGGQTVYHVQVGAYHDRAAAEDAAAGFRHDGVPVTISPINP